MTYNKHGNKWGMWVWDGVLTRDFLRKKYIKQKKFIREIADEVGCSNMTVCLYMKRYHVKARPKSVYARMGRLKHGV